MEGRGHESDIATGSTKNIQTGEERGRKKDSVMVIIYTEY